MAQSVVQVYLHVVFSTKDRERCLSPNIRSRLWAYLASTSDALGYSPIVFGGYLDHVHGLVRMSKTAMIPDWVKQLKLRSGDFLKTECGFPGGFAWQSGYGVFSVSPAHLDAVAAYIRNQEEHHRTKSFREEYLSLVRKYGVNIEERYLFDGSEGE